MIAFSFLLLNALDNLSDLKGVVLLRRISGFKLSSSCDNSPWSVVMIFVKKVSCENAKNSEDDVAKVGSLFHEKPVSLELKLGSKIFIGKT
jgi:hypothetical protein